MIDLTTLSDAELLAYRKKQSFDAAKYKNLQLAKKVELNAAYGALGNEYFRFFDVRQAEAVTLSGKLAIRWVENSLNAYFNRILKTDGKDYIIALDTDSVYLNLEKIVEAAFKDKTIETNKAIDFLDKFCNQHLQKEIDNAYEQLADYVNAFANKMRMKRESLADKAIFFGKKHYVINIHDEEGVRQTNPLLKIMGLSAIKSSTPQFARTRIRKAIELIINGDEATVQKYIREVEQEFASMPPEEIAFPRSCNGLVKYYDRDTGSKSGTPIHVRGSLIYNQLVKQHKLTKKLPLIQDGQKIRFVYMKEPNSIQSHVIAFPDKFPDELDIRKYVDYDTQFEKTFKDPMKEILDTIGWKVEKRNDLSAFFVTE